MQKIHRILLIIVLFMVVLIAFLDYFGFHGSIILDDIAGGQIVSFIDGFRSLFEGPQGTTNFLYMTIFLACAGVGLIAILYKFIKG